MPELKDEKGKKKKFAYNKEGLKKYKKALMSIGKKKTTKFKGREYPVNKDGSVSVPKPVTGSYWMDKKSKKGIYRD
jgi:hypothetical protein